jgi:hypothetical protein
METKGAPLADNCRLHLKIAAILARLPELGGAYLEQSPWDAVEIRTRFF